jgi:outer membrane lipoprotein carrier protein
MNRYFLLFFSSLIVTTSLFAKSSFNDFFENLETLKANFIQENININEQLVEKSTGFLILKRPNQLYWETQQPNNQILIVNKNALLVYDVDLEQASEQSAQKFQSSPLYWLLQNKKDQQPKFIITRNNMDWFSINDPQGNFEKVLFGFKNKKLLLIKLLNAQGTLFIKFKDIEINSKIDEAIFNLKLPEDVDIIR